MIAIYVEVTPGVWLLHKFKPVLHPNGEGPIFYQWNPKWGTNPTLDPKFNAESN